MPLVAEVMALFRGDSTDLESAVGRSNNALATMNATVTQTNNSLGAIKTALGDVGIIATGAFGVATAAISKGILGYQQEVEQLKIAFDALNGPGMGAAHVEQVEKMSLALSMSVEQVGAMNETLNAQGGLLKDNAVLMKEIAGASALPGVGVQSLTGQLGALYQSLQQGGAAASGARGLVREGVISKEDLNRLQAAQDAGASADEIMKMLTDDMARFNAIADQQSDTLKGLTTNFHTLFDQDFARTLEPAYDSIKKIVGALNELLQSAGVQQLLASIGEGVNHIAEGAARMVGNLAHAGSGASFEGLLGPLRQMAPLIGALTGLTGAFASEIVGKIPVIRDLLGPIAEGFSGVKASVIGFLLASKETRDALGQLAGAVIHLIESLSGVVGTVGGFLNALVPIAATVIKIIAAIVDWVASTAPLVAVLKAVGEALLAMYVIEKIAALFTALKTAVMVHVAALDNWIVAQTQGVELQTAATVAAERQAAAETAVTGALVEQTAALQGRNIQMVALGRSGAGALGGGVGGSPTAARGGGILAGLGSGFTGHETLAGGAIVGSGIAALGLGALAGATAPGSAPHAAATLGENVLGGAAIGAAVGGPWGAVAGAALGAAKSALELSAAAKQAADHLVALAHQKGDDIYHQVATSKLGDLGAIQGQVSDAAARQHEAIAAFRDKAGSRADKLSDADIIGLSNKAISMPGQFSSPDLKNILTDISGASDAYKKSASLGDQAQKDVNAVARATGMSVDDAAKAIAGLNVDLSQIDPSTKTGREAIADLIAKIQSAATAHYSGIFSQYAPGAMANLAQTNQARIAGSMGETNFGGPAQDKNLGILSQGLGSIIGDQSVPQQMRDTAQALQAQGAAYQGANGMTDQYIQRQENVISRAQQVRSAHQAVADAAIGEMQATQSLAEAQLALAKAPLDLAMAYHSLAEAQLAAARAPLDLALAYHSLAQAQLAADRAPLDLALANQTLATSQLAVAKSGFDLASAQLSLTTSTLANTSAMLSQADAASYLTHLLSGGLPFSYNDLNSKVVNLDATQQAALPGIYDMVAAFQAEEQAQESLQVTYDALNAHLTQLTDAQRIEQDVLKANIDGTRAYDEAINNLQNRMSGLSAQMDRYKLAHPFASNSDPYIQYLQAQSNVASTQQDLLKNTTGQALTNEKLVIDIAQRLPEISFSAAKAAAQAIGALAPEVQALTIHLDVLRGPLDAANASLAAQKKILDPLVSTIAQASATNTAYMQSQNQVEAATWALASAQLNQIAVGLQLQSAIFGVSAAELNQTGTALQLQSAVYGVAAAELNEQGTALGVQAASFGVQSAQLAERGAAVNLAAAQQGVTDAYNNMRNAQDGLRTLGLEMARWRNEDMALWYDQVSNLIRHYGDLQDAIARASATANSGGQAFDDMLARANNATAQIAADANASMNNILAAQGAAAGLNGLYPGSYYGPPQVVNPQGATITAVVFPSAIGNIFKFAEGGENHFAQIARAGTPQRMWNEPETGGEAYIPLAVSKRARSMEILKQVMAEFGMPDAWKPQGIDSAISGMTQWSPRAEPATATNTRDWTQTPTSSVNVEEGAVQVTVHTSGSIDSATVDEIQRAVEEALTQIVQGVAARGGVRS